jgi:hypothetical protein|tara:strand:- start:866 stop:1069 length:204 start_codon:yes stop_codon:yes gene_type:complete
MKLELMRGTIIEGQAKDAGSVIEVDATLASFLMSTGKAKPFAEKEKKNDRSVGLEKSNTPKTTTRKK